MSSVTYSGSGSGGLRLGSFLAARRASNARVRPTTWPRVDLSAMIRRFIFHPPLHGFEIGQREGRKLCVRRAVYNLELALDTFLLQLVEIAPAVDPIWLGACDRARMVAEPMAAHHVDAEQNDLA